MLRCVTFDLIYQSIQFPNTNIEARTKKREPLLHRYRNFNRCPVVLHRHEMHETKRDDLLAGDKNFMQIICDQSKPFTYEEVIKLANEGNV